MNDLGRMLMILVGGLGIAVLLICGFLSLPGFGAYPGPYSRLLIRLLHFNAK